jgi:hypothetical protein
LRRLELNYYANAVARSMKRRSSLTIALIVGIDDEADYLTQRQVECAQREATGLQQTRLNSPSLSVLKRVNLKATVRQFVDGAFKNREPRVLFLNTALDPFQRSFGAFAIVEFQYSESFVGKATLVVLVEIVEILGKAEVDQLFCRQTGQFRPP